MSEDKPTQQNTSEDTQKVNSDKESTEPNVDKPGNIPQENGLNADSSVEVGQSMDTVSEMKVSENPNPESNVTQTLSNSAAENKITETTQETVNNDINMETETASMPSIEINAKPKEANTSIGSLGLLGQYASSSDEESDSSSSDESESDESESESDDSDSNSDVPGITVEDSTLDSAAKSILDTVMSHGNYRDVSSDSSEVDTDSDVECIGTIPAQTIDITNEEELQGFLDSCDDNTSTGPVKAKGEFSIADLPPIEELTITVAESDCVELGKISGTVDTLVLVESLPDFAAVDIDTVLFLDKGNRTLGQVFDVMGNVSSPIYCVRFNNTQDITAKNITVGLKVYVAPQTEYTNFIVLSDLMKVRGCDASWENDIEAPDGCSEFSDDEEERISRRQQNLRNRNKNRTSESSEPSTKVTVKSEPNTSNNRGRPKYNNRGRNGGGGGDNKPPRFYKDNRGYANPDPGNYFQHQQRMQPGHHNYSWHTAAMHGMPPPGTSSMSFSPYAPNQILTPNIYPNPFAMQANHMNYASPFSLQAFPPLPPPINTIPPHHQPPQYNRKKPGSFHQK